MGACGQVLGSCKLGLIISHNWRSVLSKCCLGPTITSAARHKLRVETSHPLTNKFVTQLVFRTLHYEEAMSVCKSVSGPHWQQPSSTSNFVQVKGGPRAQLHLSNLGSSHRQAKKLRDGPGSSSSGSSSSGVSSNIHMYEARTRTPRVTASTWQVRGLMSTCTCIFVRKSQ